MRLSSMLATKTTAFQSSNTKTFNVAIVGGGITGSCAASVLTSLNKRQCEEGTKKKHIEPALDTNTSKEHDLKQLLVRENIHVHVDLFDQGRSGVGGRTSHRRKEESFSDDNDEVTSLRFDHGCQFFRSDTQEFSKVVSNWMSNDLNLVSEWKGTFLSNNKNSDDDFFGLPSKPPFYVGYDGMQSISKGLLEQLQEANNGKEINEQYLNVFTGTRVAEMERDAETKRWYLNGVGGAPAYHDTPEAQIKPMKNSNHRLGSDHAQKDGYDAVILTDVSSSFGQWHRASAGVPEEFAERVRERVGSRVPLFTAMVAFDRESGIPFDAASFEFENNKTVWFAAKMNSKPMNDVVDKECWTLVSTPEYAMKKIEETPMQSKSGEFIPQSKDYLTSVPGPDLEKAFRQELTSNDGILGDKAIKIEDFPSSVFLHAQRWGSAMPCHRLLDDTSKTRKLISGVFYDSGRASLAPTIEIQDGNDFISNESLMLFQAGDMMSTLTPGFESAALSGIHSATSLLGTLCKKNQLV